MRLKIIKPHKKYSVGQTVDVSRNVAYGLIDKGVAIQTKDVVTNEWQTNKEVDNGNITVLQSLHGGRRKRKSGNR